MQCVTTFKFSLLMGMSFEFSDNNMINNVYHIAYSLHIKISSLTKVPFDKLYPSNSRSRVHFLPARIGTTVISLWTSSSRASRWGQWTLSEWLGARSLPMFLSISSNTLSWYSGWLTKHRIELVSTDQVVSIPVLME
jgi:hypothetical protein